MRRVWFKSEMKQAILAGKKTATSRNHLLPMGPVKAVSGLRFKAQPFAILEITDRIPTTWARVIALFYGMEGFDSPIQMQQYLIKEGLMRDVDDSVFFHRFKLLNAQET